MITQYRKTSNKYSDDGHIDFDFDIFNLSSINKKSTNAYNIINATKENTVEAVLVCSTTDEFKAPIESARKVTEDNGCTVII